MEFEALDPTSALGWGTCASALFIGFYGIVIGMTAFSNVVGGYYVYPNFILLLVCLMIVVLNVVSIFGLYSFARATFCITVVFLTLSVVRAHD